MGKIYSKLTKTRKEKFHIETAIYKDNNGIKTVKKHPLNDLAEKHIQNMYRNRSYFNYTKKVKYLPCELKGKDVCFPFIEGESLYTKIINAAKCKEKDKILKIFRFYSEILKDLYPETSTMVISDEFVNVFGYISESEALPATTKMNVDLTFDNLIFDAENIFVIDYEWVFDFLIPIKFPVYRALVALFAKNRTILEAVITEEEVYDFFEITKTEREIFEEMNVGFGYYVDGKENSYNMILSSYIQPKYEEKGKMLDYLQIYWGENGKFSEERMKSKEIQLDKPIKINVNLYQYDNCDCIRIDPSKFPCLIQVIQFYAETDSEVIYLNSEDISVEGMEQVDKYCFFSREDPQFVVPIKKEWRNICFEYILEIEGKEMEIVNEVSNKIRTENKLELSLWQDKFKDIKELCEKQEKLLAESAKIIAQYEETIQLQKDKLAYIESTTVYRKILKKKVENIHLWDKLN